MMNVWEVVWVTAKAEFSDLGSMADVTRVLMRLGLALILGGIIGFEREMSRRDAGMRTHMMVAVGAALFVVVPLQSGFSQDNMSRVLQGLVSGVGFLGAGAIIKISADREVRGLTTAASLWLSAGVGVAAGLGREATAILSVAIALVILSSARMFKRRDTDVQ
ncbi:MgtC/SapB family protein [Paraburkholderia sp. BCC1886]|uniref:MgtC/SapB family protein n=1 Tax=Paraburkholderia sp. BCC1886 TaxID=2562670 RepID=UPI0011846360|nr:MgtC/SapB family protein [Paraburkholderia sp. BCC1886]